MSILVIAHHGSWNIKPLSCFPFSIVERLQSIALPSACQMRFRCRGKRIKGSSGRLRRALAKRMLETKALRRHLKQQGTFVLKRV